MCVQGEKKKKKDKKEDGEGAEAAEGAEGGEGDEGGSTGKKKEKKEDEGEVEWITDNSKEAQKLRKEEEFREMANNDHLDAVDAILQVRVTQRHMRDRHFVETPRGCLNPPTTKHPALVCYAVNGVFQATGGDTKDASAATVLKVRDTPGCPPV